METFCKFVRGMDENLKQLIVVHHTNMKKHQGPFKKEYQGIGMAYKLLATTFALDTAKYSVGLTNAINHTGDTYNEIGHLFEHQPKSDTAPLLDILNEYKGHLGVYPEVLKVHEGAMGKAKECKKQQEEGKISESEVQGVLQRADVISYGSMAEMNHFQHERVKDFKAAMQDYLQAQIDFYKEITKKLEVNLEMYKSA